MTHAPHAANHGYHAAWRLVTPTGDGSVAATTAPAGPAPPVSRAAPSPSGARWLLLLGVPIGLAAITAVGLAGLAAFTTLRARDALPPPPLTPQPFDVQHQGELVDSDPSGLPMRDAVYDAYPVRLRAGWTLTATMTASYDTYLFLVGPSGEQLAQDDDGGGGLNSRITFVAPTDGLYVVRATAYSSATRGPYQLHLSAP